MFDDIYQLSEDPTIEEITGITISKFEQKWKTGYKYEPGMIRQYTGAKMNLSKEYKPQFYSLCVYCGQASRVFLNRTNLPIPELLSTEVMREENNGGTCIYISVLAACLCEKLGIYRPEQMRLIQGFYKYRLREDWPKLIPWSKLQTGIHAFLTADDAVIDFSITIQEEHFFEFGELPFVAGMVPDAMEFWGFPEDYKTIKEYARSYARASGMTYVDWISVHERNMIKMAVDALNSPTK